MLHNHDYRPLDLRERNCNISEHITFKEFCVCKNQYFSNMILLERRV